MRHQLTGNRLGRNTSWRKATLRDMAKATLKHERIRTTKAKAKEARKLVDRLITLGKRGTLAAKRKAFSILCDHQLVSDLFNKIAVRFKNRPGGYTRVIPLSMRRGDHAQLAYLELTEKDIQVIETKKAAKSKLKKKEDITQKDKAESAKSISKKTKKVQELPGKEHLPESTVEKKEKETPQEEKPKISEVPVSKEEKSQEPQEKPKKKMLGGFKKIFKKDKSQ
ncbi:MAG: 50S ribosomal protein L17 [Candidatus Omnitrophota bacterium]